MEKRESTPAGMRRLLDELRRYRVELELQNENLRRTWEGLEVSPNKYDKLYNLSPVGYFTFDAHGLIREVNPAGAQLLGIEGRLLVNKPFVGFIAETDDRDIFSKHLESALQGQGIQKCEIRLTRKDGTVTSWQLQSVAVETVETKEVYILTSFAAGTFGKQFREELQNAYDNLELTAHERTGELKKALVFLADLYRFLGNPHASHRNASGMPESAGGVDTINAAGIGQDGNREESAQWSWSTAPRWKNYRFFPITRGKSIRLYVVCALAAIAAVSFALLQPDWKTTGVASKKPETNMVRSSEPGASAGKMKQGNKLFAVIKFKVSPQGVIYLNEEKKGAAPMLSELQVEEGKYAIAIKYKNYETYRRIVNLAPQERILIEHDFQKSTATAAEKNIPAPKSTSQSEKAPRKTYPAIFTATDRKKTITVSKRGIRRLSDSQVIAWVRIKEDPRPVIKEQQKEGLPTRGYDNYSHTLVLQEFDCRNRTFHSLQINDYNRNGKVLWSRQISKEIKQPIVTGSVGEALYKFVCQGSN